jgi:hypothetical protein
MTRIHTRKGHGFRWNKGDFADKPGAALDQLAGLRQRNEFAKGTKRRRGGITSALLHPGPAERHLTNSNLAAL